MNNNELYHHGVLGMKWGRRKQQESSGQRKVRRKDVLRDYKNELKIQKAKYKAKQSSGQLKGTEKHWSETAYNNMKKKYGKVSINDAIKHRERLANGATIVGGLIGIGGAILLNKHGLI